MKNAKINVSGTVQTRTEKALLIDFGTNTHWIPISQISDCDYDVYRVESGDTIEIEIPEWLAEQKDLI